MKRIETKKRQNQKGNVYKKERRNCVNKENTVGIQFVWKMEGCDGIEEIKEKKDRCKDTCMKQKWE